MCICHHAVHSSWDFLFLACVTGLCSRRQPAWCHQLTSSPRCVAHVPVLKLEPHQFWSRHWIECGGGRVDCCVLRHGGTTCSVSKHCIRDCNHETLGLLAFWVLSEPTTMTSHCANDAIGEGVGGTTWAATILQDSPDTVPAVVMGSNLSTTSCPEDGGRSHSRSFSRRPPEDAQERCRAESMRPGSLWMVLTRVQQILVLNSVTRLFTWTSSVVHEHQVARRTWDGD